MNDEKKTHGGARPGAGRPLLGKDKRKRYTFRASPENLEYLKSLPHGEVGPLLNRLLDEYRGRKKKEK